MRRTRPPALITDAAQNPADELRRRQTRYVTMMMARAACLILAAVLAMLRVPLLGLWVAICLVGAVLLPWLAVIWANNRQPRPEHRLVNRFRPKPPRAPETAELTTRPAAKIIDAE